MNPNPLAFGSVTVNGNKFLTGQLVATGGSVVVSSLMSNSAEFTVSGISRPGNRYARQQCELHGNLYAANKRIGLCQCHDCQQRVQPVAPRTADWFGHGPCVAQRQFELEPEHFHCVRI